MFTDAERRMILHTAADHHRQHTVKTFAALRSWEFASLDDDQAVAAYALYQDRHAAYAASGAGSVLVDYYSLLKREIS